MNETISPMFSQANKTLNVLNSLADWVHIIGIRNVQHGENCRAVHVSSGIWWKDITTFHIFRF